MKSEAFGLGFQQLPRDLTNVNAWKNMFDPYIKYHSPFLLFLTFYVAQGPFPNVIRCFSWWCKSDVTSESKSSDVMFNVACELSHSMGMTEFSSTAKNRTNSAL